MDLKFTGVVHLVEQAHWGDGRWYASFAGEIEIVEAKSWLGFNTGAAEYNWFAVVSGEYTREIIPGCKISSITSVGPGFDTEGSASVLVVP